MTEKAPYIDVELLDDYLEKSGYKIGYICSQLGISRQAFDKKRRGLTTFRLSEIYVLCDLLRINDDNEKNKIFYPKC